MSGTITRDDAVATVSEWAQRELYGPANQAPIDYTSKEAVDESKLNITRSLVDYLQVRNFNVYSVQVDFSDDAVVIEDGQPRKADMVHIQVQLANFAKPITAGYAFAGDFFDIDGDGQ